MTRGYKVHFIAWSGSARLAGASILPAHRIRVDQIYYIRLLSAALYRKNNELK